MKLATAEQIELLVLNHLRRKGVTLPPQQQSRLDYLFRHHKPRVYHEPTDARIQHTLSEYSLLFQEKA